MALDMPMKIFNSYCMSTDQLSHMLSLLLGLNDHMTKYIKLYSLLQETWVDAKENLADEGFSESFNKCLQNIQMNFSFSTQYFW